MIDAQSSIFCSLCGQGLVWYHGVTLRFQLAEEWFTLRICKSCMSFQMSNEAVDTKAVQEAEITKKEERDERIQRLLEN